MTLLLLIDVTRARTVLTGGSVTFVTRRADAVLLVDADLMARLPERPSGAPPAAGRLDKPCLSDNRVPATASRPGSADSVDRHACEYDVDCCGLVRAIS